ncbi:sugar kinase [Bifidobacterium lemurum]|uniref:Sugar kinase n=2 Tax=Bifidobacterium lemurum TaxID=1603886 RepID=A0A261FQK8_9BIFI|nr:sugar kinase [Bifidobacterium lemurum]
MTSPLLLGIDIGGTKIMACLYDSDLTLLAATSVPTPASEGGDAMIAAACAMGETLALDLGGESGSGLGATLTEAGKAWAETHAGETPNIAAIGVGAAGLIDSENGVVTAASDSFQGWAGYEVRSALQHWRDVPVAMENDVNAFLIAQMANRPQSEQRRSVLGLMLGTGVGGALWLNGGIFRGTGYSAGEIGHIPGFDDVPCTCGARGHLEGLAGGRGIARLWHEATGGDEDTREVGDLARSGDERALALWDQAGDSVAKAVAICQSLLDIDEVVIGGSVAKSWDLLEPAIRRGIEAYPVPIAREVAIAHADDGDDTVARGAAASARLLL